MTDSLPGRRPRLAAAEAAPPDALSSLPIDVLDNIFSRLHIYDVVRTSALSRAWRRRWETLPSVDLSHSAGISASDVDALFLRRGTAPVLAFRLPSRDPSWVASGYFHDWLLCLSRRGVQDLALGFLSQRGFIPLHSCLFSCRELTRLNLIRCGIPPAPAGHAGFPNLKRLRLESVFVAGGAGQGHAGREFASLIAASPVLEEAELLKGRPLPAKLKQAMDANDASIEAQHVLIDNQKAELVRLNARFDAELARLKKLWAGAPPGSLPPIAETPAATPSPAPAPKR